MGEQLEEVDWGGGWGFRKYSGHEIEKFIGSVEVVHEQVQDKDDVLEMEVTIRGLPLQFIFLEIEIKNIHNYLPLRWIQLEDMSFVVANN